MRGSYHWSMSSFLVNTLALICVVQGRQIEDKKKDYRSAANWYGYAASWYEYGKCWKGVAQAKALYALARAKVSRENMDAETMDEIVADFKAAHELYVRANDGKSAEVVTGLCGEAMRLVINGESVAEQLREMPFLAAPGAVEDLEGDAGKMASVYTRLPFERREALGRAPRRNYVPYAVIAEYYRRTNRRAIAEQVQQWGVAVNRGAISSWLSIFAPELDNPKGVDDAVLFVRRRALDPEFRHMHVLTRPTGRAAKSDPEAVFGMVSARGIVSALENMVFPEGTKALPGSGAMPLTGAELEAVIREENRSALFYEAFRRRNDQKKGIRVGAWPPEMGLSDVIERAVSLLEEYRADRRFFSSEGRLLRHGVVRGIDMALAALAGPEWAGIAPVESRGGRTAAAAADQHIVEVLSFRAPNEALLHCAESGKIIIPGWADMAPNGRDEILQRVRYAVHDRTREMQAASGPSAFIFAREGDQIKVDVTALQEAANVAVESMEVERMISAKYPNFARRLGSDHRWRLTMGVFATLATMEPQDVRGAGGGLIEDAVIEAFEFNEIVEILTARIPEFTGQGDAERRRIARSIVMMLKRQEYSAALKATGMPDPGVIITAYRQIVSETGKVRRST
jgi:hypothetical protein